MKSKQTHQWPLPGTWVLLVAVLLVSEAWLPAQTRAKKPGLDPVQWSLQLDPAQAKSGDRVVGRFTATIEPGWRLYAPTTPIGGPLGGPPPTKLALAESPAVASANFFQPKPERKYDPIFEMDSEFFHDKVDFLAEIQLNEGVSAAEYELEASAFYSACNDKVCLRPVRKEVRATLTISAAAEDASPVIPDDYAEAKPAPKPEPDSQTLSGVSGSRKAAGSEGLIQFAFLAFGFGLVSIFTPCVFPMIPITMSYFVSTDTGSRRNSIVQASVFCLGVVVLFTGLGALVSVVMGPFGTVQLASSVWVNLFIAGIFVVFAASLFGAFEITVPSSALTSLHQMSSRGGIIGTLLMGLVFALASFACTGPFVGTLLAGSLQDGMGWPIFGMAMFSSGMVLPFFFLAMFPSYLGRLPKSGGWLGRIKKTMAFIILAAALKYLSNVDMMYQLEILTRERFLSIWIVLLALGGFYLLGMFRFSDEIGEANAPIGLGRFGAGAVFLICALSLAPGMFGGRLGELDAYIPPLEYSGWQVATAPGAEGGKAAWLKDNYSGALAQARASGKPLLVAFTGYSCSNCKWMKYNMFTEPDIVALTKNMVLLELYTDGHDDVTELNQELQLRYGSTAIPFYLILRPDESLVAEFAGRTRDVGEFQKFLESGGPTLLTQNRPDVPAR